MPDEIKWIKITTGLFDDEKIKVIETMPDRDAILIVWIKLLILAGRNNAQGIIYFTETIPYTDEMLAAVVNRPLTTVRLAVETFLRFGMIEQYDQGIFITNWAKHQNVDGMEKVREQWRLASTKYRDQKKQLQLTSDGNNTSYDGHMTVMVQNKSKNKKENKNKNKKESIRAQPEKKTYGEFLNVFLTDEEYEKLKIKFNGECQNKIESLSRGIESKGYKYKSHYATILNWARDDEKKGQINASENRPQPGNSDGAGKPKAVDYRAGLGGPGAIIHRPS